MSGWATDLGLWAIAVIVGMMIYDVTYGRAKREIEQRTNARACADLEESGGGS